MEFSDLNRRKFLQATVLATSAAWAVNSGKSLMADDRPTQAEFAAHQKLRRKQLWSLLGDLPRDHRPQSPKLVKSEQHAGFTLEHLVLDLNGLEPVPALLLIPDKRQPKAPGMLYIHWHGGQYAHGKDELLLGHPGHLEAYAPVLAEQGIVTLAIDSWCFGERNHGIANNRIEMDTFKEMLWRGQVLWGMMMWDEQQALSYLASRPEVDADRLGAMGLSMGATKAWWLAALDERVRLCIDLCCLTDFDELIRNDNLRGHGVYYFVPGLLKQFNTSQINELIVPRAHLSVNGRQDHLTPPAGVEKIRDYLLPLYRNYGKEADCRIELYDCGHQETPEMRKLIGEWLDRYLVASNKAVSGP
jgi:dienelactone hydrolase